RAERRAETQRNLGSEVDVDETQYAVLAEDLSRAPRLPDQALVDLRAVLDFLVRVDAHARVDDGLVAERHLIADGDALLHPGMRAHVAVSAQDRALDQCAAPDVTR